MSAAEQAIGKRLPPQRRGLKAPDHELKVSRVQRHAELGPSSQGYHIPRVFFRPAVYLWMTRPVLSKDGVLLAIVLFERLVYLTIGLELFIYDGT